ncbi:MAG: site-specific DNA-methyltransferase [Mesorhizobium sp.]|nr:MAG: site-specific DNA-methyltransferase [Mesorhizobium sp.]
MFQGDCMQLLRCLPDGLVHLVMTSPPYFMGKNYDRSYRVEDFYDDHQAIAPDIARVTRLRGNVCWQVGYHVQDKTILPLDFAVYETFRAQTSLSLRNRIIWHFGHGTHAKTRFSGRHETILWYGKGTDSYFALDSVRVPQKYPGKKHYKGPNKGEFSGNPLGKNPSDVWEIPNVNSNHVEKTAHPCQFPIALAQRVVKALCPFGGLVLDPFAGSGTTGLAAVMEGRAFIGADTSKEFCEVAEERYLSLKSGTLAFRPADKAIWQPGANSSIAKRPEHFFEHLMEVRDGEKTL